MFHVPFSDSAIIIHRKPWILPKKSTNKQKKTVKTNSAKLQDTKFTCKSQVDSIYLTANYMKMEIKRIILFTVFT